MAFAGALALGASVLLPSSPSIAQSTDAAAVAEAVAALTKAMLAADKAQLDTLVADQLSYGHSGGVIQTKAEFVDVIASKKTVYKSIVLSDQTVVVAGSDAIVRHAWASESESGGKSTLSKIGILQVWQKQGASWKLLARQAFKS
jgi:hypothetical protein